MASRIRRRFIAAGCGERIDGVAEMAEQVISIYTMIKLGVADDGLQAVARGAWSTQAAFLAGNDDAGLAFMVMTAIAAVNIGPFRIDAARSGGLLDRHLRDMAVIGCFFKGFRCGDTAFSVGRGGPDLGAKFVAARRLAAIEAGHFWGVKAVELPLLSLA